MNIKKDLTQQVVNENMCLFVVQSDTWEIVIDMSQVDEHYFLSS